MITLKASKAEGFTVLNLSDPQLSSAEWEDTHVASQILKYTVEELVSRVRPNLITVSGDLAWAEDIDAHRTLSKYLDSFQIPWAPVLGNHDNQSGVERSNEIGDVLENYNFCLFEKGPSDLGVGNYVICIEEGGRPSFALIMMDSHDRYSYTDENGKEHTAWGALSSLQLQWYTEKALELEALGCRSNAIITHIPPFYTRKVFNSCLRVPDTLADLSPLSTDADKLWRDGANGAFGVMHENISSAEHDNGFGETLESLGKTSHVIFGHNHIDNASVEYNGIRYTFSNKLGIGCYYEKCFNGGTVLSIKDGVGTVHHEYVDISNMI